MAHNFKLTGDYYVSIDGSDSNNGLTKDTPKRTIQAALNLGSGTIIVGAGVYRETLSRLANVNSIIVADGVAVLDGLNQTYSINLSTASISGVFKTLKNFIITNYSSITLISTPNNLSIGPSIENCILQNIGSILMHNSSYSGALNIYNSIFINCKNIYNNNVLYNYVTVKDSIFINSSFTITGASQWYAYNCYIDKTSVIGLSTNIITFNYNNIQGSVTIYTPTSITTGVYQDVNGRYYDLSITTSTGSGTVGDPYGRPLTSGAVFNYPTNKILYPTYNANSISADPQFNNIQAQDFTLQASSPMIGKASDGVSNIGGTKYAIRHTAKGDAFNTSAISITDLSFQGNDYKITSPATTGEVVSAPIAVSTPSPKVVQKITYNGLLEFNKLITGGTVGNQQVPDAYTYASTAQPPNVAGANPDRLVYEMRYSTQVSQPATSAEWDNGGLWTAGNYGIFEWNTKPSVDNLGVGNGDPAFNAAATPVYLNATWIQIKVKLRNNYA